MKPVIPLQTSGLNGLHYFVNDESLLQAYEYTYEYGVLDLSAFAPFVSESFQTVKERVLQNKFGLRVKGGTEPDTVGWTEFEIHGKRSTVMLPDGMPMSRESFDISVTTEWGLPDNAQLPRDCNYTEVCKHGATVCFHCTHCTEHEQATPDVRGPFSGGKEVAPGSELYSIVSTIIAAL